jgi:transposase
LREISSHYAGRGSKAWPPSMMVSLFFYGYATGIFSSRKLERASHDSLAFRYICANTHPDHESIATFRRRFALQLEACFTQILLIAGTMGALKLGTVSLDGTKVKANASRSKALSWKHANRLEAQIKAEVETLMRLSEDASGSAVPDGLDIPAELTRREVRLETIAKAKQELRHRAEERHEQEKADYEGKMAKRRQREKESGRKPGGKPPRPPADKAEPRQKDQVNLTDEESRIMPSGNGFEQAYNAQAAVDIQSYLVVENHVTPATNDKREVAPALDKLADLPPEIGKPGALLADTGYYSQGNAELCESRGVTAYFAQGRQKHNQPLENRFSADPEPLEENASALAALQHRMKTKTGKALYALRKCTVETVIGIIKHVLGFRTFSMRGLELAGAEWSMVCSAWNLKRLHKIIGENG